MNNWLPALNMLNGLLASTNQYYSDKKAGNETALSDLGMNIFATGARTYMAEGMRRYGNMNGYVIDNLIPKTDKGANQFAIGMALMGGMSPYGMGGGFYYGSPFMAPPMYPPMGGGGTSIRIWC